MSRHDGVSCDSCLKGNFRGRRYKCLVCYDYDLCADCFDVGTTTTRHTSDHAMQCILTRNDFDMYYGGEALTVDQPQSFTCPFCGKKGYLETTLQEHIIGEHSDSPNEVVCPICAALPGGDPNHVTDDFATHLTLEHRTPREFDEPAGVRHAGRIPHTGRGRGTRTRRGNIHFPTGMTASGGREAMDPIAELLSQLSSVRSRAVAAHTVSSQLQQLEMQLQSTRQQLERLPRRQGDTYASVMSKTTTTPSVANTPAPTTASDDKTQNVPSQTHSNFLLSRCTDSPPPDELRESTLSGDHSLFVQELLATTLAELLPIEKEKKSESENTKNVTENKKESENESGGASVNIIANVVKHDIETDVIPQLAIEIESETESIKHLNTNQSAAEPVKLKNIPRQVTVVTTESQPVHVLNPRRHPRQQFTPPWFGATSYASAPHPRQQRHSGATAKRSMLKHGVDGTKKNDPPH